MKQDNKILKSNYTYKQKNLISINRAPARNKMKLRLVNIGSKNASSRRVDNKNCMLRLIIASIAENEFQLQKLHQFEAVIC